MSAGTADAAVVTNRLLAHSAQDRAVLHRFVMVLTASGTRYHFDSCAGTVRRVRDDVGPTSDGLRRDFDQITLLDLTPVEIGKPMSLMLDIRGDGIATVRTTNDVVSVVSHQAAEGEFHHGEGQVQSV